jgi:hypothetical protein
MNPLHLHISIALFLISISPGAFSQKGSTGDRDGSYLLFEVERNRDPDKIYYEPNVGPDGRINVQNPVNIYWKRYSKNGEKESLTRVQRNYSYGLKYLEVKPHYMVFQFAASKERDFVLKKNPNGDYKVYTQSDSGERELIKMYVHFTGGTYLVPVIGHIELTLKDPKTDKIFTEAFEPSRLQKWK